MANPAQLLHQLLTEWRGSANFANPREQRIAVRHLDAIAALLDEMDAAGLRTELFRRYFDKWVGLTLHHPHEWQTQATGKLRDNTALEHLEHLADRLDGIAPQLADGGLDQVRAIADSAKALVEEEDSLDPLLRQHVLQVIAHVHWCVENYAAVGDFDLREAVERLMSTMLRTGATLKDDEKVSKWRAWMGGFVYPFATSVAAAIPSAALTQLALGSGG